jgi:hypothetical protein
MGGLDRGDGTRRQRDHRGLATLADDGQGVVPAVLGQIDDVRAAGFTDPQAVDREETRQRVDVAALGLGGIHPVLQFRAGQSCAGRLGRAPGTADVAGRVA